MAATKTKIKQFIDEARTAIAQHGAFGLSASQALPALHEIRDYLDAEIDAVALEFDHNKRVRARKS